MKNKARLFGIYLPVFAFILVGAITLKTIATINFFNYKYHYFTNDVITTIATVATVAGSIFFLTYMFTARKSIRLIPSFSSPANYIPSAAASAALIFLIAQTAADFRLVLDDLSRHTPVQKILPLAVIIFAALSVVHLIFNTIFIRTVSVRRANFGLCTVVFLCIYVAYLYFDTDTPINSPIKTADQMAYLFSALFFLYEVRLSLGREKWKHYIAFGFIASLLTAFSSIPAIITYFVNGEVISKSIYESILTFTLFLFITSKLLLTGELINDEEAPFVKNLKAAAAERELAINPANEESYEDEVTELAEENDENQISISEISYTDDGYTDNDEKNGIADNDNSENKVDAE